MSNMVSGELDESTAPAPFFNASQSLQARQVFRRQKPSLGAFDACCRLLFNSLTL